MTDDHRLLVIMRHGRAEQLADADEHRSLTDRGRAAAAEAGRWLASRGIAPDQVFVSSADRAVATWEAVATGLSGSPVVAHDEALYAGGPDAALELLRTAPPESRCVLMVGHNPTAGLLAHQLDDGSPDPEAFREMSSGFPAAAVAVLDVRVPWADLDVATGRITAFHVGRG
ncbi:MAG: SixA phosphatase family protein [Marmoricola sp.]